MVPGSCSYQGMLSPMAMLPNQVVVNVIWDVLLQLHCDLQKGAVPRAYFVENGESVRKHSHLRAVYLTPFSVVDFTTT